MTEKLEVIYEFVTNQLLGTAHDYDEPESQKVPTFPKAWFDTNKGKKPPLVQMCKDIESGIESRKKFLYKLNRGTLTVNEAVMFIIVFSKKYLTVKSQDNWTSFERELAKQGENCTPLNLVDLEIPTNQESFSGSDLESIPDADEKQYDLRIMLHVVSMYRLGGISRPDYRIIVQDRVKSIFQQKLKEFPSTVSQNVTQYSDWLSDSAYRKAIAAVDMFLLHFGVKCPYQYLRVGTLASHYRDCAMLVAYDKIAPIFGFTPRAKLCHWIYVRSVAKSFMNITKTGNEIGSPDSYTPYCKDFELVERSPYSTSANPEFHLFIHTAGALMGETWSKNAIVSSLTDAYNCCYNGLILAYGHAKKVEVGKYFGSESTPLSTKDLKAGTKPVTGDISECEDANGFFLWLHANGTIMDENLKRFLEKRTRGFEIARDNTISHHLYNSFS